MWRKDTTIDTFSPEKLACATRSSDGGGVGVSIGTLIPKGFPARELVGVGHVMCMEGNKKKRVLEGLLIFS